MLRVNQKKTKSRGHRRLRRHRRIRKTMVGTAERPRLAVFRSARHIGGQVIDDAARRTLVGFSTVGADLGDLDTENEGTKAAQARIAGKRLAEKAVAAGIETVVFDRGGYKYHGRVRAFAEGAREGGLTF